MEWIEGATRFLIRILTLLWDKRKPSDAIKDAIKIRIIAEDLISSDLSIDYFFLVMVHNGGRRIIPHGFKYWSIVDGSYNKFLMKNFEFSNYQNTNIDFEFAQFVAQVYEKKTMDVQTDHIPAGVLKTNYDFENVKFTRVFYLKQDRRALWYLAVGTTADNEKFSTNRHRHEIGVAVNQVKNIINKY